MEDRLRTAANLIRRMKIMIDELSDGDWPKGLDEVLVDVDAYLAQGDCSQEHTGIYADEIPHR